MPPNIILATVEKLSSVPSSVLLVLTSWINRTAKATKQGQVNLADLWNGIGEQKFQESLRTLEKWVDFIQQTFKLRNANDKLAGLYQDLQELSISTVRLGALGAAFTLGILLGKFTYFIRKSKATSRRDVMKDASERLWQECKESAPWLVPAGLSFIYSSLDVTKLVKDG